MLPHAIAVGLGMGVGSFAFSPDRPKNAESSEHRAPTTSGGALAHAGQIPTRPPNLGVLYQLGSTRAGDLAITDELALADGIEALSVDGCAALLGRHLADREYGKRPRPLFHTLADRLARSDPDAALDLLERALSEDANRGVRGALAHALSRHAPDAFIALVATIERRGIRREVAELGLRGLSHTNHSELERRFDALLLASGAGNPRATISGHNAIRTGLIPLLGTAPELAQRLADQHDIDLEKLVGSTFSADPNFDPALYVSEAKLAELRAAAEAERSRTLFDSDPQRALAELAKAVEAGKATSSAWQQLLGLFALTEPKWVAAQLNQRLRSGDTSTEELASVVGHITSRNEAALGVWRALSPEARMIAATSHFFISNLAEADFRAAITAYGLIDPTDAPVQRRVFYSVADKRSRSVFDAVLAGDLAVPPGINGRPRSIQIYPPLNSPEWQRALQLSAELPPAERFVILDAIRLAAGSQEEREEVGSLLNEARRELRSP